MRQLFPPYTVISEYEGDEKKKLGCVHRRRCASGGSAAARERGGERMGGGEERKEDVGRGVYNNGGVYICCAPRSLLRRVVQG